MMFAGAFTGRRFIDFVRRLVKQAGRKACLVVDHLRVRKRRPMLDWVERHRESFRLIFLPKDGPDLNPGEYLNHDVKSNAVGRRRAKDKADLKLNLRAYLRSTQKQPDVVKRFFQERHVLYAAMKTIC